jgi:hypothetical protein
MKYIIALIILLSGCGCQINEQDRGELNQLINDLGEDDGTGAGAGV